jgi:hypothetical protein
MRISALLIDQSDKTNADTVAMSTGSQREFPVNSTNGPEEAVEDSKSRRSDFCSWNTEAHSKREFFNSAEPKLTLTAQPLGSQRSVKAILVDHA